MSLAQISKYDMLRQIPIAKARTFLELENRWHVQYCRKYKINIGDLTSTDLEKFIRMETRNNLISNIFTTACRALNYNDYDYKYKYILIMNFLKAQNFFFKRVGQTLVAEGQRVNADETTPSLYLLSKEVLRNALNKLLDEHFLSVHMANRLHILRESLDGLRYMPGHDQFFPDEKDFPISREDHVQLNEEIQELLAINSSEVLGNQREVVFRVARPMPLAPTRLSTWWLDGIDESPDSRLLNDLASPSTPDASESPTPQRRERS